MSLNPPIVSLVRVIISKIFASTMGCVFILLKNVLSWRQAKQTKHFTFTKQRGWHSCEKKVNKTHKNKKRYRTNELRAFEKISVSDSDYESISCSSSEEREICQIILGELFNVNHNHSSKSSKQHTKSF